MGFSTYLESWGPWEWGEGSIVGTLMGFHFPQFEKYFWKLSPPVLEKSFHLPSTEKLTVRVRMVSLQHTCVKVLPQSRRMGLYLEKQPVKRSLRYSEVLRVRPKPA